MYFPLICTWIVNAGSTVGKDSGATFNWEAIFEVGIDEDWVCFSVGVVAVGVGEGLIRERVANRRYSRNPEKIFIFVIANHITYIPIYNPKVGNAFRVGMTWIVGMGIRAYFLTPSS